MDSKEKYNQIIFLETIKTGRTPKRSGLGARLFLLGGFTKPILCTNRKNIANKHLFNVKRGLTTRLEYYKSSWGYFGGSDVNKTSTNLQSDKMKEVFNKYLGDHIIHPWGPYIHVYYNPNTPINWGQLDADLVSMYPNKCRIDKRGFVYFKYN